MQKVHSKGAPAGMEGAFSLRMRALVLAGLATTSTCGGGKVKEAKLHHGQGDG